jgi:hypothetical protein
MRQLSAVQVSSKLASSCFRGRQSCWSICSMVVGIVFTATVSSNFTSPSWSAVGFMLVDKFSKKRHCLNRASLPAWFTLLRCGYGRSWNRIMNCTEKWAASIHLKMVCAEARTYSRLKSSLENPSCVFSRLCAIMMLCQRFCKQRYRLRSLFFQLSHGDERSIG